MQLKSSKSMRGKYIRLRITRQAFAIIIGILLLAALAIGFILGAPDTSVGFTEMNATSLEYLLRAQKQTGVSWMKIGVSLVGHAHGLTGETPITLEAAVAMGQVLARQGDGDAQTQTKAEKKQQQLLEKEMEKLSLIDALLKGGEFPLEATEENPYTYENSWGAERTYGGDRKHEGVDIMAKMGIPIRAIAAGKVIGFGWMELGGWQAEVQDENGVRYYYAHMASYGEGVKKGVKVEQGAIIGYVGDTGYGPEGTTGKFDPHLHMGLYDKKNKPFNPYPYALYWDGKY